MAEEKKTKKTRGTTTRRRRKKKTATKPDETVDVTESPAKDDEPVAETAKKTKKRVRRSTKKKTKATRTAKTVEETEVAEVAAEPKADEPAPKTKRRRRKKTTRKTKSTKAKSDAVVVETEPTDEPTAAEAADDDDSAAPEPEVTRHEAEDGSIIIRFPPVAPPPFVEPVREAEVAAAPPTPRDDIDYTRPTEPEWQEVRELLEPEEIEEIGPDADATTEPEAPPEPADEPAKEELPDEPTNGEQHLTRSQKRRLRRRRHDKDAKRETKAPEAPPTEEPAPTEDAQEAVAVASDEASEDVAVAEPEEIKAPGGRKRRRSRRKRSLAKDAKPAEKPEDEKPSTPASDKLRDDEVSEPVTEAGSADQEMIINFVPRDECRIAILEDGKLEEIYLERASYENHVGNIYKGTVTNVEASIQAAFVDFGLGKNGFLHITDLSPDFFPGSSSFIENVGRKMPRRARPPIQKCLRRGQEVVVQITKEGIGTKGPTLSTYLSIPGRFLVMMPGMRRLGISRKIEDEDNRLTLRKQLSELELPEDIGFIARTAAQGRTKRELQSDLNYLVRLWRTIQRRLRDEASPAEVYREADLVIRTIRDVFSGTIKRIIVDDPEVAERAREFLSVFSPRSRDIVVPYESPEPIFHKYRIEQELENLHSRRVALKSGGSLVIDATEALVAIDVNSGRFRTEDDAESTAYKINLEAADEIARQLRLRDMGGVIVCDFIDMRAEGHKRDVERRLSNNLRKHKERAKVLRFSQFGLIELTRQRQRASLTRNVYQDCASCRGTGLVKTLESVVIDVMRLIQLAATREHVYQIDVAVAPEVANLLQNRKRALLHQLETRHQRVIVIRPQPSYSQDQLQLQCYDQRGRPVPHE